MMAPGEQQSVSEGMPRLTRVTTTTMLLESHAIVRQQGRHCSNVSGARAALTAAVPVHDITVDLGEFHDVAST